MKKIFVTGGHYTPARAVVEKLTKYQIFYVGRKHALEGDQAISLEFQEMSNQKGITFLEITTGRFQRSFTKDTIPSLLKIPLGLIQSLYWVIKYKPDVVMSFGGYVSIPVSTAARLWNVPIINHEQVPVFDFPSTYLNFLSTKVLVSFPHLVKSNEIFTGNPLREEIFQYKKNFNFSKSRTIYVTGGNQGSHVINIAIFGCLNKILKKYNLIWQTGDSQEFKDYDMASKISSKNLLVKKYFGSEQIGDVYHQSDIIIGRSGANTVIELAALGKPAILIPIPWVHDAEQQKNAEALAQYGGTKIISQASLTPEILFSEIENMMENLTFYLEKSESAKTLYVPTAAQKIVLELEMVLHEKKN